MRGITYDDTLKCDYEQPTHKISLSEPLNKSNLIIVHRKRKHKVKFICYICDKVNGCCTSYLKCYVVKS